MKVKDLWMKKIRQLNILKIIYGTGMFHVALANVLNKVVSFICNIIIVRLVTQEEYGFFSSANNVIEITLLITGLGILSGAFQYSTEMRPDEDKNGFLRFSFIWGTLFDLFLTSVLVIYSLLQLSPIREANIYILILCPTVIMHFVYEYFGVVLRSKKKIKAYTILLNSNSFALSIFSCIGAWMYGIIGLLIGRTLAYLVGDVFGLILNRKEFTDIIGARRLNKKECKDILSFSFSCCISGALNRLLYLIDVLLVTYMIVDAQSVALYKVGTQIPEALEFIPNSILVAIMPYVVEHNTDKAWLKKWTKKIYLFSIGLNSAIVVILLIFAPVIVELFWGKEYAGSVVIFRILSINYFVMASFRQIGTNMLSALKYVNYNMLISIITCVANLLIDYVMINKYGIEGAAYATLIVVIISSIMSFPYVMKIVYSDKKL